MEIIDINLIKSFAFKKHIGQVRPNKNKEPKIIHLSEVAYLVKKAGGTNVEVAAAFLHDTVEDTNTTIEEIRKIFNDMIAYIVEELTDPPEFVNMELTIRKQKQADRIKNYNKSTKLVKIADQISNVKSVYNDPPVDWGNEQCLNYAQGAKKIVEACVGTNSYLEQEFFKMCKLCMEKYTVEL